ncbi:MAG TPA: hypothetical protein ENJ56_05230 [Anaerolineae bacterium]|nr:hypothetical protein [Anaerolineae bacterium]
MNKKLLTLLLFGLILGLFVVQVGAQSSANYNVGWHVIAGGGGSVASANYRVDGTIGQGIAATDAASSASYRVSSGYWVPMSGVPTAVGLDSAETTSLIPFWLLTSAASILLTLAFLFYRRQNHPTQ